MPLVAAGLTNGRSSAVGDDPTVAPLPSSVTTISMAPDARAAQVERDRGARAVHDGVLQQIAQDAFERAAIGAHAPSPVTSIASSGQSSRR